MKAKASNYINHPKYHSQGLEEKKKKGVVGWGGVVCASYSGTIPRDVKMMSKVGKLVPDHP